MSRPLVDPAKSRWMRADRISTTFSVPLYATDEQLARIILGEDDPRLWRGVVKELSRDGLPAPRALFGNRRYLPAVLRYFDRREGLLDVNDGGYAEDGAEYF